MPKYRVLFSHGGKSVNSYTKEASSMRALLDSNIAQPGAPGEPDGIPRREAYYDQITITRLEPVKVRAHERGAR